MKILYLVALIGCVYAEPRQHTRIVGGSATTIQRYPFMVNLEYFTGGVIWAQSCGGSLLNSNVILSAALCFTGETLALWRARLGSSQASTGGETRLLASVVTHPLFSATTLDCDVALVRLDSAVVYSDSIMRGSIAGANYIVPVGTTVTAIGWGDLYMNGPSSEQLQYVDVQVINKDVCASRYAYLSTLWSNTPAITDNMFCTGALDVGGRDACQGDYGGPIVHSNGNLNVIVGVTSWSAVCGDSFYPGVSADVATLTEWIQANV